MGAGNLGGGRNLPVGGRPLSKPQIEPTKFRVYDKATGAAVWDMEAPARPLASPMTYMHQGKQYIVVAAGSGPTAELIAFALGIVRAWGLTGYAVLTENTCAEFFVVACWPVGLLARWPGLRAGAAEHQLAVGPLQLAEERRRKPEGELKAQLDEVDKAIADARRSRQRRRDAPADREGPCAAQQGSVDAAA